MVFDSCMFDCAQVKDVEFIYSNVPDKVRLIGENKANLKQDIIDKDGSERLAVIHSGNEKVPSGSGD